MGRYFVGWRESDIAVTFDAKETDKFFDGSVTLYGRNEGTNVSHNVTSNFQLDIKKDNDEMHNKLWRAFVDDKCRQAVARDKNAEFFPYNLAFAERIPKEYKDRIIYSNNIKLSAFLNSKFRFKDFIKGELPEAPYIIESGQTVLDKIKSKEYPEKKEVVIQTEFGESGNGTVILTKKNITDPDFAADMDKKITDKQDYIVSNYIKNTHSIGIQMNIADKEIAVYPPSVQIMKGPSWVGSDIFEFSKLPDDIKAECNEIALKFGKMVQKKGWRGFIGIDALVGEDNKVYVVETNPRFTGATGLLNIVSHMSGAGSVYEQAYKCQNGGHIDVDAVKNILPVGRRRYANFIKRNDGKFYSTERKDINREGFDKVNFQEDHSYTHTIYEQVGNYNAFDDRDLDRNDVKRAVLKNKEAEPSARLRHTADKKISVREAGKG